MREFNVTREKGVALRTGSEWRWQRNVVETDLPATLTDFIPARQVGIVVYIDVGEALAEDILISALQRRIPVRHLLI